jgi:hypothetical protein
MAQQQARGRPAASRRHRMVGVFLMVIILVATGSLAFVLFQHGATAPGGGTSDDAPGGEAAARNLAAAWVADQVSRAARVSCDPVMCRALEARGIAARDLVEIRHGTAGLLRSEVIVATPTVRSEFGGRLDSVFAPGVIASFGSGNARIDIRVIASRGAAAYWTALGVDMGLRSQLGTLLLHTPSRILVSKTARRQIAAEQVDSRLLVTIVDMAARHPVFIAAFSDSAPGAGEGSPLRSAEVAEGAGPPRMSNSAYMRSMRAFLLGTSLPYPPDSVGRTQLVTGSPALRIEFAAPSPLGLPSLHTR